jgi:predicted phage terminase large subunit-like protein
VQEENFPAGDPRISGQQKNLQYIKTVVSVDSAESEKARADFSAITVWRETPDGYHYLVDGLRGRWGFPDLITAVEGMAQRWEADIILMEKKGAGAQYIQARADKGLAPCAVISIDPTGKGDKVFRMDGVTPIFMAKRVLFPSSAPWLADFLRELLQFPASKNDDFADTVSQYLNWSRNLGLGTRGTKKLGGGF